MLDIALCILNWHLALSELFLNGLLERSVYLYGTLHQSNDSANQNGNNFKYSKKEINRFYQYPFSDQVCNKIRCRSSMNSFCCFIISFEKPTRTRLLPNTSQSALRIACDVALVLFASCLALSYCIEVYWRMESRTWEAYLWSTNALYMQRFCFSSLSVLERCFG